MYVGRKINHPLPLSLFFELVTPPSPNSYFPPATKSCRAAMLTSWQSIPYADRTIKQCIQYDYKVSIPRDLMEKGAAPRRNARKPRKKPKPIPVTRKVKVHPMIERDSLWCIYPDREFFEVCERESVLADRGGLRVFWHFYHKTYPGRSFEVFSKHDIHHNISRLIRSMYLTHKKDISRCRHLTFNRFEGKAYVSVDLLKKHLLSVRKERKNKRKLRILQSKYPSIYEGITLQSFTYHLWRLKNPKQLKKKLRKCVIKRFRASEIDQCIAFLRENTKMKSFMDWWSLETQGMENTVNLRCTKAMWQQFKAYLVQQKKDTTPWSFRRFLYCARRVCSSSKTSFTSLCPGETCGHQCCYTVCIARTNNV